jgi:UDP-N-acetylglucosamine--N-acetylmuramyl-(pentapeptide) pyrophosphoryl-undecaprenol N-acetylglucosamine transferase
MSKKSKIFVTSGGTGGHIIPARCLALELTKQGFDVTFLGDTKYLSYIKENDGFSAKIISSSQIKKSPFFFLKAAIKIAFGFVRSLTIFLVKRPKYVVAFGGYATFPVLAAAVITKTVIILHEQNSHLGKVNRIFAKYAKKIALSFKETSGISEGFLNKTYFTGNPIRPEIMRLASESYKLPEIENSPESLNNKMGYDVLLASDFYENEERDNLFKILVIGGSGGAKIFSEILPKAFFNLSEEIKENIQVIQQCRNDLVLSTFEQYRNFNINIIIDSFFEDMPKLLRESHLVIARSGASSVFEFCAAKRPMILIPFAAAADNHQEKNARYLENHGAAIVIRETEFTINQINDLLKNIIFNKNVLEKMSAQASSLAVLDATQNLIKLVEND